MIIPPMLPDEIESAIDGILKPFYEGNEENSHTFWDFYSIGGRWAGTKMLAGYDQDKIEVFNKWLTDEGITVSGIQCGKQELKPESQIPNVDAKWNEMFPPPDGIPIPCPLFRHSNDPYNNDSLPDDICLLSQAYRVQCTRVIIAGPNHKGDILEAKFMLCDSRWNGVNFMTVNWDGKIKSAVDDYIEKLSHYKEDYQEKMSPKDDWLTVTVDYHS
jgi:hypothetical protein